MTSMDYIRETIPSSLSLSNLVIRERELQVIRALSNKQIGKTRKLSADFIEEKESCKIIILYGMYPLIMYSPNLSSLQVLEE